MEYLNSDAVDTTPAVTVEVGECTLATPEPSLTMSDTITCPNCQTEIEISEALTARLKGDVRREFEQERKTKEAELSRREEQLAEQQKALNAAKTDLDEQVNARLAEEREKLTAKALEKAKADIAVELKDQAQQLAEAKEKIAKAQEAELSLRKEKRELEDERKSLELTLSRKLDEERGKIREEAKKEAAAERELKDAEKDKVIGDLRHQIADLQRKSEQGSQQLQGEVMELGLEEQLRRMFPIDDITPVPKGIHGGDVLQGVHDTSLGLCGHILWESKRTKNWSDTWLPKLRDDQRTSKAQLAVLVSIELPDDVTTFAQVDGVWITSWHAAMALATVLRHSLMQLATANRALVGRDDKMEHLYKYLAGPEFKHHVEGIVESFVTLKDELEREKRSTQRMWKRREKQLERAVMNTAGMYGDLQGIVGASLPQIAQLESPDENPPLEDHVDEGDDET